LKEIDAQIEFTKDDAGKVSQLVLTQGGRIMVLSEDQVKKKGV
jgi:hypothetical protein